MLRILFLIVLLHLALLSPQAARGAAEWIGPERTEPNQWIRYRKTFMLEAIPRHAEARIAVDSKYWLWLNGELIVREGGLKRGPAPGDTYCDPVDLRPYLREGENTLAILVWHFGKQGFSHQDSGRSGLWFSLQLGAQALVSDASWRLSRHPALSTSADTPPNPRLPESSLCFDARRDDPAWTRPGYSVGDWAVPELFGTPPCAPWGNLVERPIPQWKDSGLREYDQAPSFPLGAAGSTISVRLPYNAQVTPWLQVEAKAGLEIDIRTDNFNGGGEPNVHAKYITRNGVQEFEAFGWMNGHEVHYRIPAGVRVLGLKYRETGYQTEFRGSFQSDDPDLDLLWRKAARTLYLTMRDNYMDCPDRERAQWWGDVVNELGEVFYTFDSRGSLLTRKAILELVHWQRKDGTLYSPVPAGIPRDGRSNVREGTWSTELPVQMLASLSRYGFWTYYLHGGDAETVRHVYPAAKRYLELWQFDHEGLIAHRQGDWDWSDWGREIDARVIDNAWYYLCMEAAIEMAKLTANEGDVSEWQRRRDLIARNFNRVFWNGREYRSPGYGGVTDDRANGLAVVAGLALPEQYPSLASVLARSRNASPYMEKYVLEALYKMGMPDAAVSRMKERYRAQLDSPLSTLWEGWGIGPLGFGGGTSNHAWSGGPLTVLSQYAAGISPTKPGYEAYGVFPQMGSLRHIRAAVPTSKGEVLLVLDRTDDALLIDLTSPAGTAAEFGIPKLPGMKIELSDASVRPVGEDDHYLRIPIAPGRTRLRAQYLK